MSLSLLQTLSPLYSFWRSEQKEIDNNKRLLLLNKNSPASSLFEKEPYKWENLFQSIVREIIKGDSSSIKGFCILTRAQHTTLQGSFDFQ